MQNLYIYIVVLEKNTDIHIARSVYLIKFTSLDRYKYKPFIYILEKIAKTVHQNQFYHFKYFDWKQHVSECREKREEVGLLHGLCVFNAYILYTHVRRENEISMRVIRKEKN